MIGVYTLRPIAEGEEITFDYNSVTEVCTFLIPLYYFFSRSLCIEKEWFFYKNMEHVLNCSVLRLLILLEQRRT
jgi:hypothetical protein